jgi:HTH-type transcriptional regulator/antitoxin HigA
MDRELRVSQASTEKVEREANASPHETEIKETSAMAVRIAKQTLPDTYFDLVKLFPLTHIRDGDHLAEARKVIEAMLEKHLDPGEQAYLDALTDLIESYEDAHEPIPDASEADVLGELMRANGFTQHKLAKRAGIAQSTISAVLNGTRTLTKEQVVALARLFRVSPAAFLPG